MEFIKNSRFEILDNVQVIHDEENSHYKDLLDIQYVEFNFLEKLFNFIPKIF